MKNKKGKLNKKEFKKIRFNKVFLISNSIKKFMKTLNYFLIYIVKMMKILQVSIWE